MTEKELKKLINKKQKGFLTKKEEAILMAFEKKMMEKNEKYSFLNSHHKSKIGQDIFAKIVKNKSKHQFVNYWMKIAAILIVSISIGGASWYFSSNQQLQTATSVTASKIILKRADYGKKLTVTLPDGSRVKLNSGSEIKFPEKFSDTLRQVAISGEAFFEVTKNPLKPFIVTTSSITTKVLGTSFNIKSYKSDEDIVVTLATGKISVDIQNEDEIILTPSYQVSFNKSNQSITKQKVNLDKYLAWKDGILRFDNEKLSTAIPKLEKWFDVEIILKGEHAENCSFTGVFTNASLENILENITFIKRNLKYKFISAHKVEITGNCRN